MIALLEGTIAEKSAGEVILMTGGVGFRLLVSMNTLATLPAAEHRCRLFTHLSVSEDALDLYGFATQGDSVRRQACGVRQRLRSKPAQGTRSLAH